MMPTEAEDMSRYDPCDNCGHWRFYHRYDEQAACTIILFASKGECDCGKFQFLAPVITP
jgi:hypothetical protein